MRLSDLVSELVESTIFSKLEGVEQIRGGVCHAAARPQMNHSLVSIIKEKKKDKPAVCCKVHRKLAQHTKHLGTDFLVDKVQEESSMH